MQGTAWKVSKYGVISGPYFLVFGLNTAIYGVFSANTGKYGPEITPCLDTFHAVRLLTFFAKNFPPGYAFADSSLKKSSPQSRRSVVFIGNFELIYSVSIVDFEQVNVSRVFHLFWFPLFFQEISEELLSLQHQFVHSIDIVKPGRVMWF